MMRYVCGIDIGSSKIAACIGCFRGRELLKMWWDSVDAVGVKQGSLQDIQGLVVIISQLLKKLRAKSGVKVKSVYLGIASQNIVAKHSKAVIALVERGNKSVTESDIRRVTHQAQILGSCLEEEILHAVPLSYSIDDEDDVTYPLGLYGHKLKVDLYLICAKSSYINTLTEIINRLGLRLNGITLSGLAVSQTAFNPDKLEGVNILCDIGKDITQILIFKESSLSHYQILGIGGDDLTFSLSQELNLPYSLAEDIKISYGRIQHNYNYSSSDFRQQPRAEDQNKEIIIKRGNDYSTLSQNSIIQILSRASWRIAEVIRDAVKPHILAISLPFFPEKVTLFACGRTACLDGFLETLEIALGLPVKITKVSNSALLVPLMRHHLLSGAAILNYLASFGLIIEEIKLFPRPAVSRQKFRNILSNIPGKIKEIYQEYF